MKRIVCCLLVAMLMVAPVSYGANSSTGEALKELGILNGDSNGDLKEASLITRQEMVAVVNRLKDDGTEFVAPHVPSFTDVPVDSWAYTDVEKGLKNNVTSGIGNGLFGWNQNVTYQQAIAFMLKVLKVDFEWQNTLLTGAEQGIGVEGYDATAFIPRAVVFELMGQTLLTRDSFNVLVIDSLVTLSPQAKAAFKDSFVPKTAVAVSDIPVVEEPVVETPKEEVKETSQSTQGSGSLTGAKKSFTQGFQVDKLDWSLAEADNAWTRNNEGRAFYEEHAKTIMDFFFTGKTVYETTSHEILNRVLGKEIGYSSIIVEGGKAVAVNAFYHYDVESDTIIQFNSSNLGMADITVTNLRVYKGQSVTNGDDEYATYYVIGEDTDMGEGQHEFFITISNEGHTMIIDHGSRSIGLLAFDLEDYLNGQ